MAPIIINWVALMRKAKKEAGKIESLVNYAKNRFSTPTYANFEQWMKAQMRLYTHTNSRTKLIRLLSSLITVADRVNLFEKCLKLTITNIMHIDAKMLVFVADKVIYRYYAKCRANDRKFEIEHERKTVERKIEARCWQ